MSTTTADDLLAAVLRSPEDDGPRLIYADYLEEQGDVARAEFIRSQVAAALPCLWKPEDGMDCDPWNAARPPYRVQTWCKVCGERDRHQRRAVNLWLEQRHLWGNLPGPLADATNEFGWWHRGFVHTLTCSWADWLIHADGIVANHPVREVQATTRPSAGQDADYIWFLGFERRWHKWQEVEQLTGAPCLGKSAVELLCRLHWPNITFTLPED